MPFPDAVQDQAFRRSGAQCECRRTAHPEHRVARCATRLTRESVDFHHVAAVDKGGSDGLSNCEVLCRPCHRLTDSYGRH